MPDQDEKCYACGRPFKQKKFHEAETSDGQRVLIGPECFRKVLTAPPGGYQPPLGGPRLFALAADVEEYERRRRKNPGLEDDEPTAMGYPIYNEPIVEGQKAVMFDNGEHVAWFVDDMGHPHHAEMLNTLGHDDHILYAALLDRRAEISVPTGKGHVNRSQEILKFMERMQLNPLWKLKITHYPHLRFSGTVSEFSGRPDDYAIKSNPETEMEEDMVVPMNLSPVSLRDRNSGKVYSFTPEGPVEVHVDENSAAEAGLDVADVIESARRITSSGGGGERSSNPVGERVVRPTQGARLLIGFNVGTEKVWTVDGVLNLAFWFRRQQVLKAFKEGYASPSAVGGDLGMTFLIQKGAWQTAGDKKAYPEDGTSLIMLNTISEEPQRFEQDMENLAEELATRLKQQAIIVEHQVRGVVEQTVTMLPR